MIIRFRSKDGQYRLNCDESTVFSELLNELILTKLPPIDSQSLTVKLLSKNITEHAKTLENKTISELGFRNGEMLQLDYEKENISKDHTLSNNNDKNTMPGSVAINFDISNEKQSKLDDELDKDPGLIPRTKSSLCKHSDKGMCEYCSPLPPWDKEYQADNNIKHISFHAYIDELNSKINKKESGSSYIPPLKPSNFAINKKCPSGHEPWPKGICSKCQPSAITLQRQNFRMVDHVEFMNSEIINEFINSWRLSGKQRIGLMFGKYDRYDKIPLGIKCQVEAIYELPQIDQDDGIVLENWTDENEILEISNSLGLKPIGIIFTDLSDSGKGDGSVICKRHVNSFFLSSLEIIFAVKWQLKFPNLCKWSETGKFSSKFVTCVVSGNSNGEIDISAYQASEPAEGLVKSDLICASTHPNQMFIKEQTNERYVPEIFYQMINEYGLQIKNNAKPSFPVEYLLVSLTHGFPENSNGLFTGKQKFTIENREYIGEKATLKDINNYISGDPELFLNEISNFHFLLYLCNEVVNSGNDLISKELVKEILKAVRTQDQVSASSIMHSASWQTLQTVAGMV